eukprot:Blabericola_migrator_1__10975@NODE_635_length_7128_cov_111_245149_g466_i0_p1_GENE_NODE_635_length_7128_cov_111_245149_g466_i0NODE_635_length_7128_cov_111_245149_g466_i0_p1_ORF_typecomplete_len1352_score205_03TPR_16/PF13432_6/4e02TPR_16/PF13432_6/0_98TPR_12/PF13424_6/6_7e02TPR_12/PF13424_6/7_5e02TPR_12/PF13424_6/1_5TPR_15/PF13429_6/0_83TPR_15/PF13429_6/6_5e02_NODE_635_length_7128_cov_111_245149_g466_i022716326
MAPSDRDFQVQEAHKFVPGLSENCIKSERVLQPIKFFPLYSSDIWRPSINEERRIQEKCLKGYGNVTETPEHTCAGDRNSSNKLNEPSIEMQDFSPSGDISVFSSVRTFSQLCRLAIPEDAVSLIVRKSGENAIFIESSGTFSDDGCPHAEEQPDPAFFLFRGLLEDDTPNIPQGEKEEQELVVEEGSSKVLTSTMSRDKQLLSVDRWVAVIEGFLEKFVVKYGGGRRRVIPLPADAVTVAAEHRAAPMTNLEIRLLNLLRRAMTTPSTTQQQLLQSSFGDYRLVLVNDIPCLALRELIPAGPAKNLKCVLESINYMAGSPAGHPDAVDLWLRAILSQSSHIALCYSTPHEKRSPHIVATEHLLENAAALGVAEPTPLPYEQLMATSLHLLNFLQEQCTLHDRYWLYKAKNAAHVMLIHLSEGHVAAPEDGSRMPAPLLVYEDEANSEAVSSTEDSLHTQASLCLKLAMKSQAMRRQESLLTPLQTAELIAIERELLSRGLWLLSERQDRQTVMMKGALLMTALESLLDKTTTHPFWVNDRNVIPDESALELIGDVSEALARYKELFALRSANEGALNHHGATLWFLRTRRSLDVAACRIMSWFRQTPTIDQKTSSRNAFRTLSSVLLISVVSQATDFVRCYHSFQWVISMSPYSDDAQGELRCEAFAIISQYLQANIHLASSVQDGNMFADLHLEKLISFILDPTYVSQWLKMNPSLAAQWKNLPMLASCYYALHPLVHLFAPDRVADRSALVNLLGKAKQYSDIMRIGLLDIWTLVVSRPMTFSSEREATKKAAEDDMISVSLLEQLMSLLCEWTNNDLQLESEWREHRASKLALCLSRLVIALALSLHGGDMTATSALLFNLSRLLQLLSTQFKLSIATPNEAVHFFTEAQYDAYRAAMALAILASTIHPSGSQLDRKVNMTDVDIKDCFSLLRSDTSHSTPSANGPLKRLGIYTDMIGATLPHRSRVKLAYHTLAVGVDLIQYLDNHETLLVGGQDRMNFDVDAEVRKVSDKVTIWNAVKAWHDQLLSRLQSATFQGDSQMRRTLLKGVITSFVSKLLLPSLLMHLSRDLIFADRDGVLTDNLPAVILRQLATVKLHDLVVPCASRFEMEQIFISGETNLTILALEHLTKATQLFNALKNTKEKAVAHYYLGRVYLHQAAGDQIKTKTNDVKWNLARKHLKTASDEFSPWENTIDFINTIHEMLALVTMRLSDTKRGVALGLAAETMLLIGYHRKKTIWPSGLCADENIFLVDKDTGKFTGLKKLRPVLSQLLLWLLSVTHHNVPGLTASQPRPLKQFSVRGADGLEVLENHCYARLSQFTYADLKKLGEVLVRGKSFFEIMNIKAT